MRSEGKIRGKKSKSVETKKRSAETEMSIINILQRVFAFPFLG